MVSNPAVPDPYRTNFRNPVLFGGEAGGFQVKADELPVQGMVRLPHGGGHQIVDEVGLHPIDYLEFRVLFVDGLLGVHYLREGLSYSMVGDSHGLLAPFRGLADQLPGGGNAVQLRHAAVQMELYPLFPGVVHHFYLVHCGNGPRPQHVFPVILIIFQRAPHQNGLTLFQLLIQVLAEACLLDDFQGGGAGIVGDIDGIDFFGTIPGFLGLDIKNLSPHYSVAGF